MVKAKNTEVKEKPGFSWDTEKVIGEFGDNKKKTEVRICTLSGRTYVSAQSYVMSAKTGDWKRTKNNTMEMSVFKDLQEMVGRWELDSAFEVAGTSTARVQTKEPNKSAEPKSGGLKAKKQAAGAKEKAAGKKK